MAITSDGDDVTVDGDGSVETKREDVRLRAYATTPQRTVFVEPDNSDGWISTDVTVDVRR